MKSPICDMPGIEFPLLALSHCRDVVAAGAVVTAKHESDLRMTLRL